MASLSYKKTEGENTSNKQPSIGEVTSTIFIKMLLLLL